jgi:hypothetical protein
MERIVSSIRPAEANEFLLIEALLRSPKIIEAYGQHQETFKSIWKEHGAFSQDPLAGSHHALLWNDAELDAKLLELGYVDVGLGILDLGIIAKLPKEKHVHHNDLWFHGPHLGGEAECIARLRRSNPRYLHLQLDLSHPPETILTRLRNLLDKGREALSKQPYKGTKLKPVKTGFFSSSRAVTKDKIVGKLKMLQCYDRKQQNRSIRSIANEVYGDSDAGESSASMAIYRVKKMIASVNSDEYVPKLPT